MKWGRQTDLQTARVNMGFSREFSKIYDFAENVAKDVNGYRIPLRHQNWRRISFLRSWAGFLAEN